MDIEPENTLGDSIGKSLTLDDYRNCFDKMRQIDGPRDILLMMSKEEAELLKIFINTHGGKI